MKKSWDLSNNIIKGVYFNSAFCLAKACPPKKVQAQVYGSRIEGVKSAGNDKLPGNALPLGDRYHFVCKFLKDLAVPVRICFGKVAALYQRFTETEMIRFLRMSSHYTDKFSKAFAARQLTIHHNQKLIPATERLDVFVSLILHNNPIKNPLRKKFNELTENIFALIHDTRLCLSDAIYNFKSTRWNNLYISLIL